MSCKICRSNMQRTLAQRTEHEIVQHQCPSLVLLHSTGRREVVYWVLRFEAVPPYARPEACSSFLACAPPAKFYAISQLQLSMELLSTLVKMEKRPVRSKLGLRKSHPHIPSSIEASTPVDRLQTRPGTWRSSQYLDRTMSMTEALYFTHTADVELSSMEGRFRVAN